MKKINKIKYLIAVVLCVCTTAISGCSNSKATEVVTFEENETILNNMDREADDFSKDNVDGNSNGNEYKNIKENNNPNEDNDDDSDNRKIKVYVCGAVYYPNVYELEDEARMIDAIEAAGGFCEDAGKEYLNLANYVKDGQKIYVPTYVEIEEAFADGNGYTGTIVELSPNEIVEDKGEYKENNTNGNSSSSEGVIDGLININKADAATLMTLSGVGESKANKIIEYREKNGGFETIEDIMLIPGIKEGMFNKIKDNICVD